MVIGIKDEVKGQVPLVLVVTMQNVEWNDDIKQELIQAIRNGIGPIAKPKDILCVTRFPKTRSGKVMRRIIKNIAEGVDIGDISTIEDKAAVEEVRDAILSVIEKD
jgi:acyl-coenzyme A synthetase/AMP-(fatty) acid ligase